MGGIRPKELKSSRLCLRQEMNGDASPLFLHYFGSMESSKFLARQPYRSVEQVETFLKKWTRDAWVSPGEPFAWVISKIDGSEPIGIFLVFIKLQEAEIHYGISAEHIGCGYASEACSLATNWLLEQDEVTSISTAVDIEHIATQRVLEKSGFLKVETLKDRLVLPAFGSESRDAISYRKTTRSKII
ncbi:GNAT family N-acetyltransferase [Bdellovibrio sp. GT3]|uniref:GNAT family N-acetyltransferase n=1 Tax=Bdellovibrio sp. GT3 TaxID=3136282 RepID=UPI0030F2E3EB